ncbi:MAG TPA: L,D-transpeptidase family protein [Accumulibacter sp.]|nr:L,D-transpeptidase family protein [Accumulibacter sp.]HMW18897.1 L,D-transpeptidase family protein [Accumulibacter sp.]HMX21550.1 L,D-transpeptidase family protein [Accumulibacter sp.]HNC17316.1 L,D-transpeptidase family protein [Accumulibacter sp.]HND79978.1 L,D-transpeptidase family protein [Accumulibacter sp.]
MPTVRNLRTWLLPLCFWLTSHCVAAEPPAWFDENGPTPAVQQAIDVLTNAAADGLEVRDYGVERLQTLLGALRDADETLDNQRQNHFTIELTAAITRYLTDLKKGRLDSRRLGVNFPQPNKEFDAESELLAAVNENRLSRINIDGAPANPQYSALIAELARYRKLIDDPAWRSPLAPPPGGKLSPGQPYADLPRLSKRLQQLGDLIGEPPPAKRYEGLLVDGIKSFQERHALPADGILNGSTLIQLNVNPKVRAQQIELALERLRWTPDLQDRRHLVVNIPEFTLRAYEYRDGQSQPILKMRVIVGKAGKTPTPLLYTEMRVVEFSPNWNVPPSIAKGETVPRLRRDPGYLHRSGMEFVSADGKVATEYSSANLDAVERGQLRLRQKPSRGNALGQIKFILPNTDGIYLHHTPTPQLFRRDRRDFSHGCVRVETPVDLASFVLADQPAWTRERIAKAMDRGKSSFATLREPLPVLVTYQSAVHRDRRLYFFPDIYEQDTSLSQALRRHSNQTKASSPTRTTKNSSL